MSMFSYYLLIIFVVQIIIGTDHTGIAMNTKSKVSLQDILQSYRNKLKNEGANIKKNEPLKKTQKPLFRPASDLEINQNPPKISENFFVPHENDDFQEFLNKQYNNFPDLKKVRSDILNYGHKKTTETATGTTKVVESEYSPELKGNVIMRPDKDDLNNAINIIRAIYKHEQKKEKNNNNMNLDNTQNYINGVTRTPPWFDSNEVQDIVNRIYDDYDFEVNVLQTPVMVKRKLTNPMQLKPLMENTTKKIQITSKLNSQTTKKNTPEKVQAPTKINDATEKSAPKNITTKEVTPKKVPASTKKQTSKNMVHKRVVRSLDSAQLLRQKLLVNGKINNYIEFKKINPKKVTPKTATLKKATQKKATPKKVTPKKANPKLLKQKPVIKGKINNNIDHKKLTPKKVTQKKATPKLLRQKPLVKGKINNHIAHKKIITKKVSPKTATPKKVTLKKSTPKKSTLKKSTLKKATPKLLRQKPLVKGKINNYIAHKKLTPKKVTPKKATPKKVTPKKITTKKVAAPTKKKTPKNKVNKRVVRSLNSDQLLGHYIEHKKLTPKKVTPKKATPKKVTPKKVPAPTKKKNPKNKVHKRVVRSLDSDQLLRQKPLIKGKINNYIEYKKLIDFMLNRVHQYDTMASFTNTPKYTSTAMMTKKSIDVENLIQEQDIKAAILTDPYIKRIINASILNRKKYLNDNA